MTQHDDFDPLIAQARGRAGSEAVRTSETIKRHAPTEMAGVLSGFWGSIEEPVRLAALAGHDYSPHQDDRVATAALPPPPPQRATRQPQPTDSALRPWLSPHPPTPTKKNP